MQRIRLPELDQNRLQRIFAAYCVSVILGFLLTVTQLDPRLFPGDFISFYSAASIVSQGEGSRLFDMDVQFKVQEGILAATGRDMNGAIIKFLYPPVFAVLFVPFSWLPLIPAYWIWNGLGICMIVGGVALLLSSRGAGSVRTWGAYGLAALTFLPVFINTLQGQTGILLFFLLTLGYWGLKRQHASLAGLALGLGLVKPQLMAVPLLYLVCVRHWRVVLIGGLVGVFLLVGSLAVVGLPGMLVYPREASQLLDDPGINATVMPNFRGTVYRLDQWFGLARTNATKNQVSLALGGLFLLALLPSWVRRGRLGSRQFERLFGQALLVGLLTSPHLFSYDLSLLLLVFFVLMGNLGPRMSTAWTVGAACFHCLFFVSFLVLPESVVQQGVFLVLIGATGLCARMPR